MAHDQARDGATGPAGDHYFSARPGSDARERELAVTLRGHEVRVVTAGGVFSPDRVDLGTQVLLRTVPDPSGSELLDLGCGWGPVALAMALAAPLARVWAVDVNERSLALTRRNAARQGVLSDDDGGSVVATSGNGTASRTRAGVVPATPADVPPDLVFDTMWSNPPIRIGKAALHELLTAWLPRLAPGGQAWLVVQRNLGADPLHRWLADELGDGFTVERAASAKGFRVLRVERSADVLAG